MGIYKSQLIYEDSWLETFERAFGNYPIVVKEKSTPFGKLIFSQSNSIPLDRENKEELYIWVIKWRNSPFLFYLARNPINLPSRFSRRSRNSLRPLCMWVPLYPRPVLATVNATFRIRIQPGFDFLTWNLNFQRNYSNRWYFRHLVVGRAKCKSIGKRQQSFRKL